MHRHIPAKLDQFCQKTVDVDRSQNRITHILTYISTIKTMRIRYSQTSSGANGCQTAICQEAPVGVDQSPGTTANVAPTDETTEEQSISRRPRPAKAVASAPPSSCARSPRGAPSRTSAPTRGTTSPPPERRPCRGGSLPSRRTRAPRQRSSPPPVAPAPPTPRWFAPSRRPCASGHT